MGRFNLIKEPWIKVIYSETGNCELVSLETLFKDAIHIKGLAGDTKTQDFAVFRIILAILHTVYSRFDTDGNVYEMLSLDDEFIPTEDVDEDDFTDYKRDLNKTWNMLWDKKSFTDSIYKYLSKWYDRFYLFDDKYPFMQVVKGDLSEDKISKKTPSTIMGKSFNRRLSESNNKVSLFSPKYVGTSKEEKYNKEKLTEDEVARWLITYHGYTGLADKVIFGKEKYKASKGWLFDIGGIILEGKNLFETLMINFMLVHTEEKYSCNNQRPCWEYLSDVVINNLMRSNICDNLAQLYTTWSRAIFIDPDIDLTEAFTCGIVKIPELEHKNFFLEPMTTWQYNEQGINKNSFTPKKHRFNESMWKSFGIIAMPSIASKQKQPGIIEWLDKKKKHIGNVEVGLVAISMMDDGNATSWLPVDEIHDYLRINDFVLTDVEENHWVPRIHEAVEKTKSIINKTYYYFLSDIAEIRNIKEKTREGFINREIEAMYFSIDNPFKNWLSEIAVDDDKDEKIIAWYKILFTTIISNANNLLNNSTTRDLKGVEKEGDIVNVVTAYNKFIGSVNKQLNI